VLRQEPATVVAATPSWAEIRRGQCVDVLAGQG
jgi:hypothetical protein